MAHHIITNENATFKTIRYSQNCPFCGTGYTFRSEDKFQEWIAGGRTAPLHAACKSEAKKMEKLGGFTYEK